MGARNPRASPSIGGIWASPPASSQLPSQAGSSAPCPKLTSLSASPRSLRMPPGTLPSRTSTFSSVTRTVWSPKPSRQRQSRQCGEGGQVGIEEVHEGRLPPLPPLGTPTSDLGGPATLLSRFPSASKFFGDLELSV